MTPSPSPVAAVLAELEGLLRTAAHEPGLMADGESWQLHKQARTDAIAAAWRLLATIRAVDEQHVAHLCSCGGRRWTDDENWSPQYYDRGAERVEGSGLIPCGFCNHGGWNTDQWDSDGAVSCEECDQQWPCPTSTALRSALAAVDVAEATE